MALFMRETEPGTDVLLGLAYKQAQLSPDPSNQNGAILVGPDWFFPGHNHFQVDYSPGEIADIVADRARKMQDIEHAERDAIFNAVIHRREVPGSVLYCPWSACHDCARAIIGTGVRKVVVHKERMDQTPERWVDSIKAAFRMMERKNIEIEYFEGPVPFKGTIIVNGEPWSPNLTT